MHEMAATAPQARVSLVQTDSGARDFEALVEDCGNLAFRVAYSVLRQREDAEDVAQEALVRCYQRFPALRDRERFRPWLVRTCWRLALDHRRSRLRRLRRDLAAPLPPPPPDAEQAAAASQFQERLWAAIDALPEKLRLVIVLAGIEGHAGSEVAALLGLPEGTVKSRLVPGPAPSGRAAAMSCEKHLPELWQAALGSTPKAALAAHLAGVPGVPSAARGRTTVGAAAGWGASRRAASVTLAWVQGRGAAPGGRAGAKARAEGMVVAGAGGGAALLEHAASRSPGQRAGGYDPRHAWLRRLARRCPSGRRSR